MKIYSVHTAVHDPSPMHCDTVLGEPQQVTVELEQKGKVSNKGEYLSHCSVLIL